MTKFSEQFDCFDIISFSRYLWSFVQPKIDRFPVVNYGGNPSIAFSVFCYALISRFVISAKSLIVLVVALATHPEHVFSAIQTVMFFVVYLNRPIRYLHNKTVEKFTTAFASFWVSKPAPCIDVIDYIPLAVKVGMPIELANAFIIFCVNFCDISVLERDFAVF